MNVIRQGISGRPGRHHAHTLHGNEAPRERRETFPRFAWTRAAPGPPRLWEVAMWIGYLIGFLAHPVEFTRNLWRAREQGARSEEDS